MVNAPPPLLGVATPMSNLAGGLVGEGGGGVVHLSYLVVGLIWGASAPP